MISTFHKEIDDIIEKQGWDEASVITILMDFVETLDLDERLLEHFVYTAEEENTELSGPLVGKL